MSARVIDRYAVGPAIASGGVATVHLGRVVGSIGFTRTVAIKRLHNQFATDPKFVSMFVDEARLAARVRHPNVVPTLDVLVDSGEVFVVLEYVHGAAASSARACASADAARVRCASRPGSPSARCSACTRRTTRATSAASRFGIVHRDVSPHNVVVGPDGVPRVIDFGFAKAFGRMRTTEDRDEVKGKLAYMAPEQLTRRSRRSAHRRLRRGARLVGAPRRQEALSLRRSAGSSCARSSTARSEPPSRYPTESTPAVDAIVMRGLARNPGRSLADGARDGARARGLCAARERAAHRRVGRAPRVTRISPRARRSSPSSKPAARRRRSPKSSPKSAASKSAPTRTSTCRGDDEAR